MKTYITRQEAIALLAEIGKTESHLPQWGYVNIKPGIRLCGIKHKQGHDFWISTY